MNFLRHIRFNCTCRKNCTCDKKLYLQNSKIEIIFFRNYGKTNYIEKTCILIQFIIKVHLFNNQ